MEVVVSNLLHYADGQALQRLLDGADAGLTMRLDPGIARVQDPDLTHMLMCWQKSERAKAVYAAQPVPAQTTMPPGSDDSTCGVTCSSLAGGPCHVLQWISQVMLAPAHVAGALTVSRADAQAPCDRLPSGRTCPSRRSRRSRRWLRACWPCAGWPTNTPRPLQHDGSSTVTTVTAPRRLGSASWCHETWKNPFASCDTYWFHLLRFQRLLCVVVCYVASSVRYEYRSHNFVG